MSAAEGMETGYRGEAASVRQARGGPRWLQVVPPAFVCMGLFLFLLAAAMQKGLDHDENMYVAGGALLAKGWISYRDFPYLQMPGLALAYAPLFTLASDLLFWARALSVVASTLTVGLLLYVAFDLFRGYVYFTRSLIGMGAALFLIANPVFIYASGLAWNHDLPVFLSVLAFVLLMKGARMERPGWWLFFSGLALGFAICVRLSFAPAVVPFIVAVVVVKRGCLLPFTIGLTVGLLPALLLFLLSPVRFIFGNLDYHRLNELYRRQTGYSLAMTPAGKLSYLWEVIKEPGTWPLYAVSALLMLAALVGGLRGKLKGWRGLVFAPAVLASLLAGLLVPTPTWYQYFYALIPFAILSALYAMASLAGWGKWQWGALALFGLGALVGGYNGLPGYSYLSSGGWVTTQAWQVGQEMRLAVGEGKVLTLSPLFPLEGGLDIYPEFASGPFAWRVAPLMSAGERREAGIVGPDDLKAFLRGQPPRAIAVGQESDLEGPLVKYAQEHGYKAQRLSNGMTLWVAP